MTNLVTRVGNLTADPELHFNRDGKAIAEFSLAYEPYDAATKTKGDVVFYKVVAWRELAENCAETLTKGMRVIVQGVPSTKEWETKDGEKRTDKVITVIAIGPELRFATATVERQYKNSNTEVKEESNDPWANEPPF